MVRIEIEEIQEGASVLEFECKPEEIGLEADGVYFAESVTASLKFFRQIDKIFIKGDISVAVESECVRCLDPVHSVLKASLEIQFRPLPKTVRYPLDDIGIGYYSEDYIDLSDEFRESLLLELPMVILCSEDCKGLCPHCGQNLNRGKCNCSEPEEVRLSKFAELVRSLEIKT